MSNFSCSLTRNITSHSKENLAFHTLLRWKMIIIQILATPLMHFPFKRLGECTFWAQEWSAQPLERNGYVTGNLFSVSTLSTFTPKSDQCQISPAASPEIVHHTVRRTWQTHPASIPFHPQQWSMSNFSCSLTRNITSHSKENLANPSCLNSLSPPRVINVKFLLQPHQKYYITQ